MGIPPSTTEHLLNTIHVVGSFCYAIGKQMGSAEIKLGGPVHVNPDSPDVARAIASSMRIQSHPDDPTGKKAVSESGNLVDLSQDQLKRLGLTSSDQVILTDAHGVEDAHGEIMVEGSNDKWYAARLIKLDDIRDLAYLKVDNLPPGTLPHVTIADSATVAPGDFVYSVGHAGWDEAISANGGTYYGITTKSQELDRIGSLFNNGSTYKLAYTNAIKQLGAADQADAIADFNRPVMLTGCENVSGNSGGGLFNSKGQLIGVLEAAANYTSETGRREVYTPLASIKAFDAQPQKFNFNYGTEPYRFANSTATSHIPALISIGRVDGTTRPPFSVDDLIDPILQKQK